MPTHEELMDYLDAVSAAMDASTDWDTLEALTSHMIGLLAEIYDEPNGGTIESVIECLQCGRKDTRKYEGWALCPDHAPTGDRLRGMTVW